jgi:DNA-directed RNA polymerase II subunit RPB3
VLLQVEVINAEAYAFDDEPLIMAADMGFPDLVSMRPRPNYFVFKVESTGALYAYNIVMQAFDLLLSKLSKLRYEEGHSGR